MGNCLFPPLKLLPNFLLVTVSWLATHSLSVKRPYEQTVFRSLRTLRHRRNGVVRPCGSLARDAQNAVSPRSLGDRVG